MTVKNKQLISNSVEHTKAIGELIGKSLEAGFIILLYGDLGSGKTAFVQGMAKGLEVSEKYYITSPTYTLVNEYPGKISLFHVDLYRLNGPDDFDSIGLDGILADPEHVVAVEWADRIAENIRENYISINFKILANHKRSITLSSKVPGANDLMDKIVKKIKEQKWD